MDFASVKAITIPEGNVTKITVGGVVLWAAGGLPSAYQEVEWVQAASGVGAYIDLGFSFSSKATIYITQWVPNSATSTYPFGAAENSGKLRCMITSPDGEVGKATVYCHTKSGNYGSLRLTENVTGKNEFILYYAKDLFYAENKTTGEATVKSENIQDYTMSANLYLFAQNYNGSPRFGNFRKLGNFQYYDKNDTLICDLIPCYRKSDGVIGMYDKARKLFLTNVGTGSFTKGADVGTAFTNLIDQVRVWEQQYYSTSKLSIVSFSNGNLVGIPIPNGTFTLRWWGKLGKPFITNTSYGREYFIFTDSLDSFSSSTVNVVWGASNNGPLSVIEESTYNGQPVYAVTLDNSNNRPYGMFLCTVKEGTTTHPFSTDPGETIITINEPIV